MKTKEFKTKTHFIARKNPSFHQNKWVIALDIGYSAVKGMSENAVYSFPFYARKLKTEAEFITKQKSTDILYRDCITGELWTVGENAQAMVSIEDSNDSINSLYGRNRYFSEIFKITSDVGIGLGLLANEFGNCNGKEVYLQTGLPPAYLATDAPMIKEALSGARSFDIKIGAENWKHIEFQLDENHVKVMSQPMGTLLSIATQENGSFSKEAEQYFKKNLLIFDPGFGTSDFFPIKNNMPQPSQTFDDLGMKQVFLETVEEIRKQLGVAIPVPALQTYLEKGTVTKTNRREMRSEIVEFDTILEQKSKEICMRNIEKMKELYNYLQELDYLVITGGCGAAWSNYIRDYLKGMENITIISGNQNDKLPYIFANVRGYYMFMVQSLRG